MKEILVQLAGYNTWANGLMIDALNQIPEAQQQQHLPSSFPTLYRTLVHMWDAESIWWQRMKLQERIVVPSMEFTGDLAEAGQRLLQQNRLWEEWIRHAQEHMLQHVFIYQNSKREQFKQPVFQMLVHTFNHGTYHRGQLVTMMRQLGMEKIPQTDFIVWSRKELKIKN